MSVKRAASAWWDGSTGQRRVIVRAWSLMFALSGCRATFARRSSFGARTRTGRSACSWITRRWAGLCGLTDTTTRSRRSHVVQGDFEFDLDGVPSGISAGQSIHIPRGVTHSSANIGSQTGCRVVLFSPAGMEGFFLEAGAPTPDGEIDLAAAAASATRHGWEFIA